jgi:hypothetical protein
MQGAAATTVGSQGVNPLVFSAGPLIGVQGMDTITNPVIIPNGMSIGGVGAANTEESKRDLT